MNKITLISVLLALVCVTSCKGDKSGETTDNVPYVVTSEVRSVTSVAPLTYPGRTQAAQKANVAFRVSGPIIKMHVNVGERVRKGQVLAELDDRDYRTQLTATQAEYDNVKADAERVFAMYREQNVTASQYDKARFGLDRMAQKLQNHRNQLADTKLLSPIDGYIDDKLHEQGETIGVGMPVYSISSSGDVEIEIFLPASDYAMLDRFTDFHCSFDVLKDRTFPLQLQRVRHDANSNQLYAVILKLKDRMGETVKITPGMTTLVYATLDGDDASTSVQIPSTAVINKDGHTVVYVLGNAEGTTEAEKEYTVRQRTVTVASLNNDGTTTISDGLKTGETVVSAGVRHLNDGDKVRLLSKVEL